MLVKFMGKWRVTTTSYKETTKELDIRIKNPDGSYIYGYLTDTREEAETKIRTLRKELR